MTWVWIAICVLGVTVLALLCTLCNVLERLDEYDDVYLREWGEDE